MSRAIVAILALFILATVGAYGIQAGVNDAKENKTVTNETWTVNISNVTELKNSNIGRATYADTVTVHNSTDDEMAEGTDYTWFERNGTVKALQGGDLTDGNDAKITYWYVLPTEEEAGLSNLVANIPKVIGLIAPLFVFVLFIKLAGG